MNVLIFGATGFIGKKLVKHLLDKKYNITVVTRNVNKAEMLFDGNIVFVHIDNLKELTQKFNQTNAIINLAGENIGSKYWTKKQKDKIINSRLFIGELITKTLKESANKPELLIQASAVGYYGYNATQQASEESPKGEGFLANVTELWEDSVKDVTSLGVSLSIIRTGIVLGKQEGLFPKLTLPIKLFMGANFSHASNYIPWIHIEDEVRAIEFILKTKLEGTYNLTSPAPSTSKNLNMVIGHKLKRPIWLKIPKKILELIFKDMAKELLMASQNASSEKLLKKGFKFKYNKIEDAIDSLL